MVDRRSNAVVELALRLRGNAAMIAGAVSKEREMGVVLAR
jgi:hypothetical protein